MKKFMKLQLELEDLHFSKVKEDGERENRDGIERGEAVSTGNGKGQM